MNNTRTTGVHCIEDEGREVPLLLTVREAAKKLAIGKSKTYEMLARGELPHVRIGTAVRVPSKALDHWIISKTVGGDN